jgi:hypothetical protein
MSHFTSRNVPDCSNLTYFYEKGGTFRLDIGFFLVDLGFFWADFGKNEANFM